MSPDPEEDLSESILAKDIADADDFGSELVAPGEQSDEDQLPPSN